MLKIHDYETEAYLGPYYHFLDVGPYHIETSPMICQSIVLPLLEYHEAILKTQNIWFEKTPTTVMPQFVIIALICVIPAIQNRAAITNWDKIYYKLGQVLQIRATITNWAITTTPFSGETPRQRYLEHPFLIYFENNPGYFYKYVIYNPLLLIIIRSHLLQLKISNWDR